MNEKLNLLGLTEGIEFNLIMLMVTLTNCSLIISSLFISDDSVLSVFDGIDNLFFSLYIVEFLLKVHFIYF